MHVIPLKTQQALARKSRFRRQIIFFTVLINVLGYALVSWILAQSRQAYQAHAETTAQNVAQMLRHNIFNSLQNVEMNLLAAKAEIERQQALLSQHPEALKSFMAHAPARFPFLSHIEVAETDSVSQQGAAPASPSHEHITGSTHFRFLRDHPLAGLHISRHAPNQKGDETLLMSRRFNHLDGSFAGILSHQFSLRHFHALFSSLEIGENGVVSLWHDKLGTIASHSQSPKDSTQPLAVTTAEWQKPRTDMRERWLFVAESPEDKALRTTAVHKVSSFPLYVSVGLAAEDYFAKWWQSVGTASESLLLFTMMTTLAALSIYHTRSPRFFLATEKCASRAPPCHRSPFRSRSRTSLLASSLIRPAWRRDRLNPEPIDPLEGNLLTEG